MRRETSGRRVAWCQRALELDEPAHRVGLGCPCVRAGESEEGRCQRGKNVGTPEGAMVFPRIINFPEGAPLPRARTRHAMEPNAKKPRRRETITLPDDLAAKLGCREVYEDELEARLMVAEKMGFEEDGRLLEAVLSLRLDVFRNALSLGDLSMLSRVNRACREGVSDLVGELRTRLSVRHYVVSKERLKWARENGCPWGKDVCSAAARGGHLEALQYARANQCPWDEDTCSAAAVKGHLEVLQWARANGCPWKEGTCSAAALGGHLGVLQWARAKECPWNEDTCASAAGLGHLDVLQWARSNGCPWNEGTCMRAAHGGHLEVLQRARANGCPWDETTCEAAVARGHLDVFQWAKENDCPGAVLFSSFSGSTGGQEQIDDVYAIIQDWADTNSTDHMSYDQAVALVSSKGHTLETLNKCLEEYRSLEFLMFNEETIYLMDY